MKNIARITLLTFVTLIAAPVFAKAPKPIPANTSRKMVNAFEQTIRKNLGDQSSKPGKTSLPLIKLKLANDWKQTWQTSKSGDSLVVSYRVKNNDARLELGSATIFITSSPFTGKLKDAPSVFDEGAAIEFEVQRWLPQKWKTYNIAAISRKVRGYEDVQSGGADNAIHSTEPFPVKTNAGQTVWVAVQAELGYKKNGMSLQKALDSLVFP